MVHPFLPHLTSFVALLATLIASQVGRARGRQVDGVGALPELRPGDATSEPQDWLIARIERRAAAYRSAGDKEVVLTNGLLSRRFRIHPNGATVSLSNLMTHTQMLRGVKPEALVTLNGAEYAVGGLLGQPEYAYLLPEWLDAMTTDPAAFQLASISTGPTVSAFGWKRVRHNAGGAWPPPGVSLTFRYAQPPHASTGVEVDVTYELYDGLPLMGKWIAVRNGGSQPVTLNAFTSEVLALVEAESAVDRPYPEPWVLPPVHCESDYSFGGGDTETAGKTTRWEADPQYTSQVNYNRTMPCVLTSHTGIGPEQILQPGAEFHSHRNYLLVHDSYDRERRGLALRRVLRTVAPWVTENPLMLHLTASDSETFRRAVDQCVETGFEMIIYSFGSGLDMENEDPGYLARIEADVEYAHARKVEVGAYSLLASRHIDDADDVINPKTGKPGGAIFGYSPCLCSRWGEAYFRKLKHFIETTGLNLLENDGSYPGDLCASTSHPGHRGLEDSQWNQWRAITKFYQWCRERGVYLNVPDYYFLAGSNKTGMGYREDNWSLPRARQIVLGRQNIYDGTWEKTPSMGWMFVPLVQYQGGGAAATIEPLREHLDAYAAHLANNLGAGVQACYRGPRLYDAPESLAVVKKWVSWFKAHRDILESDIVHVRRADGVDVDCILHVNPHLQERGLAMVYNPGDTEVDITLALPLYYTGLTETARIRQEDDPWRTYRLGRDFTVNARVRAPAHGVTWLVVQA